ncbi:MAG: hypothetical protein J5478_00945 [Bacteroidales bacterium]|nr:hypothetical protein [Bacteroidales bacterium]
MANSILDTIAREIKSQAGALEIPAQAKNTVLNGLSDSILGSLTQTITKVGGVEQVKALLTGNTTADKSPITALAGSLFTNNVLKNLKLGNLLNGQLAALIPAVMGKLSGILKDQDGDGDVDFQDILLTLKGAGATKTQSQIGGGLLGGILGKVLGGTR